MQNKKLQVWLPLLFSITAIAGIFLGYKIRDNMPGKKFFQFEKRRPIAQVLDLIQNKYVDNKDINPLADTAIVAILAKLDPHSTFIPANELQEVNEEINGSFFGIGIEFSMIADTLNIINVLSNGPAFKSGLLVGDKIIKANDSTISGIKSNADRVRNLIKGKIGSTIVIQFLRNGKILQKNIVRDIIPLNSIDAAYMMNKSVGFIRINKFTANTYREFMEALMKLKSHGLQQLILDLRDNGGGVLDEAVEIADEFLSGDKLITYTEGAHFPKKEFRCRRNGQFEIGKLIVLSNEGSASASEILLGALQDWDRAIIVGRRSFGKGLVQDQYTLSDNSALRLTVARYYTPVGRSIQKPYTSGEKEYYNDIHKRYMHGEMVNADSIKFDSSQIFKTISGKIIYGGGGISPDIFIAADTTHASPQIARLWIKGSLNDFGYMYYLLHPNLLKQYPTAEKFATSFNDAGEGWQLLVSMAKKDSIDIGLLTGKDKEFLQKSVKALVGRQLYRTEGYFMVQNQKDGEVQKVLELIQKN